METTKHWQGGAIVRSTLFFDCFAFFLFGTVPNLLASSRERNIVQQSNMSEQATKRHGANLSGYR